ncbi:MAG: hypothetical protein ACPGVT_09600 [Maricaulaceae bacterium]
MFQNVSNRPLEIIVANNDPKGSSQEFVTAYVKAAQSIGKMFLRKLFGPKLYGAALFKNPRLHNLSVNKT